MDWSTPQLLISSEKEPVYDPLIPPLPLVSIVGREEELALLRRRLCDLGHTEGIISLNGLPGVGKTVLAVALAHDHQIRAAFPDGIFWIGLGPKPDVIGQLTRWATLCGLSSTEMGSLSTDTRKEAIHNVIGNRRMLLIIDDVWKIEDALAFKVGGSSCVHLMTTRFIHIATQLNPADPILLHELSEERSLDLLHLLAPQVVEQEATKARTLVQAVGGLPLALTLTGNYLRLQAYSGQSRRIQSALDQLSYAETRLHLSEAQGPAERHPGFSTEQPLSLHAIIAVSDQYLNEEARTALYALSILPHKPDTFSERVALSICACSRNILDTLIDTGLLESAGDGHYTLHQTIADYARAHLQGTEPQERLIHYALEFVQAHQMEYELLELESSTILAALDVAHELGNQKADLIDGVCAFAPFLLLRGNYAIAEQQLQRAYQAAFERNDQTSISNICLYKGKLFLKQGDYMQAQTLLQRGLILARQLGDLDAICALLRELGWVTWKQGNYPQAETYLKEGLTISHQIGHKERISSILALLGTVAAKTGNVAQSEIYLREGLALAQQIDDREQICLLLLNLGVTVGDQGNYEDAQIYFEKGLALARKIGHYEWMSALLCNLGAIQKNPTEAIKYQHEGLALARKIGHKEWMSILLLNLGETAVVQGNFIQAELYFQETVKLAKHLKRPQLTARALYELGALYLKQQKVEEATTSFDEMHLVIPQGDLELHALLQYGQARLAAAQGNVLKARQLGETSAATLKKAGHHQFHEVSQWVNSIV